ncbi:MAG: hypothetical protein ACLR7Z_17065 [Bilophila wadsworthia]
MELTSESVLALAPDASSVKAAQALLKPGQWPTLGFNENAVWGECKGNGSKPYQVEADLSRPVFKCTCRAGNFLQHSGPAPAPRPAEAALRRRSARLGRNGDAREKRAARQEQKQENKGQPADPAAAAKREASRLKRMAAGLDDLERWMCDLIRHGLGQLSGTPAWQEEAAARMVDAQLPGIAARLRNLQGVTSSGEDWPGVVLAQFGQLQLLIDAFRHLDALSPEEQADVRAALGLSPDKDEVLATGERLSDLWLVLGVGYAEENRLWRRRVWLRGQNSGRTALLLDFSHGGKHFEQSFVVAPYGYDAGLLSGRGSSAGHRHGRSRPGQNGSHPYGFPPRSAGRHGQSHRRTAVAMAPAPHGQRRSPLPLR